MSRHQEQEERKLAVSYRRVSTPGQVEDGESFEVDQPEEIAALAQANKLYIAEDAQFEDGGISGTKLLRPGLQAMLEYMRKHKIRNLVMIHTDRFSRIAKNAERYLVIDAVIEMGATVYAGNGTFDLTTESGQLVFELTQVISAAESKSKRLRGRLSAKNAKNKGIFNSGSVPFGYYREWLPKKKDSVKHVYIIDEEQAAIARTMFDRYMNGDSCVSIARRLNTLGVASTKGSYFSATTVARIIVNPIYAGMMYDANEALVKTVNLDAILSYDVWSAAQERAKSISTTPARSRSNTTFLSNLLVCGSCGTKLYVAGIQSFRCNRARTHANCTEQGVAEKFIIRDLLDNWNLQAALDRYHIESQQGKITADTAGLEQELATLDSQIRKLQDRLMRDIIDERDYPYHYEPLRDRRVAVLQQIGEVKAASLLSRKPTVPIDTDNPQAQEAFRYAAALREVVEEASSPTFADLAANRNLLRSTLQAVVAAVHIHGKRVVAVQWHTAPLVSVRSTGPKDLPEALLADALSKLVPAVSTSPAQAVA
jgi:DNA invertase Pin-like site-specific DNA recombinase